MTAISYHRITTPAEFAELAPDWNDLVRAAPRPCPFLVHEWLTAWWTHHGATRDMVVETATRDDRLVGAVALEVERGPVRAVHLMGRHHAALADVLLARDAPAAVADELLERAGENGDYLDFFGVTREGIARRALDGEVRSFERIESPYLDISGGWDDAYQAHTSSKRRNLHRRRRKQLAALGELTTEIAHEPGELAAALEDAFRLHDLRWEGRPDGSEFTTPVGMAFHRDAIRAVAGLGMPRILLLRVDGQAVAFHYYLLLEKRMYVHRLAFDPEFSRCSPGVIATLDAIAAAGEEGVERVEFLGGGERYKLELADGVDPLLQCVGRPRTLRGSVAASATGLWIDLRMKLKEHETLQRAYTAGPGGVSRAIAESVRARARSLAP